MKLFPEEHEVEKYSSWGEFYTMMLIASIIGCIIVMIFSGVLFHRFNWWFVLPGYVFVTILNMFSYTLEIGRRAAKAQKM